MALSEVCENSAKLDASIEDDIESEEEEEEENEDMDDASIEADAESEEEENENIDEKLQGFAGMGDVISKILEKPVTTNNENVILSKSKKSRKRKEEMKKEYVERKAKEEKLAEDREKNHVIPTRSNAPKEVHLRRIATKGVVKLLNAVAANQKLVSEKMKAERTEAGKDKVVENVTQSDFMDLLKRKPKKNKKEPKTEPDDEEDDKKGIDKKWNVLRDDFMLGSSFKDWDKVDSEQEDERDGGDDKDVDSSSDDN